MFRLFNLSKSFADFILMEQFQLDDWCHGLFIKCVIKGDDWDLHVYLCVSSVIQVPASKANVRWPDGGRRSEVKGHLRLMFRLPRRGCRLWRCLRHLPTHTRKNTLISQPEFWNLKTTQWFEIPVMSHKLSHLKRSQVLSLTAAVADHRCRRCSWINPSDCPY